MKTTTKILKSQETVFKLVKLLFFCVDRIGLIGKPEVMDIKVEWTDPSVDEAQESTDLEMDGSFNSSFSPSKG